VNASNSSSSISLTGLNEIILKMELHNTIWFTKSSSKILMKRLICEYVTSNWMANRSSRDLRDTSNHYLKRVLLIYITPNGSLETSKNASKCLPRHLLKSLAFDTLLRVISFPHKCIIYQVPGSCEAYWILNIKIKLRNKRKESLIKENIWFRATLLAQRLISSRQG